MQTAGASPTIRLKLTVNGQGGVLDIVVDLKGGDGIQLISQASESLKVQGAKTSELWNISGDHGGGSWQDALDRGK